MKLKIIGSILLGLTFLSFQCYRDSFDPQPVNIRIHNLSLVDFDSVRVNSPGGNFLYLNVKKGEFSEYKKFNYSYPYTALRVFAGGKTGGLQPNDYVGEKPIPGGNYSYEISIDNFQNPNSQSFSIANANLKKD